MSRSQPAPTDTPGHDRRSRDNGAPPAPSSGRSGRRPPGSDPAASRADRAVARPSCPARERPDGRRRHAGSNRCLNLSEGFSTVRHMAKRDDSSSDKKPRSDRGQGSTTNRSRATAPATDGPPRQPRRRGRPRDADVAAELGATVSSLPDGPIDAAGLTPRQRRVLEVIKETVESRGYPPSIREMGDAVGLASSSSVAHQLKVLEAKGFLRRDPDRPRALEVLLPGDPAAAATARPLGAATQ